MSYLLNDLSTAVNDSLRGVAMANHDVQLVDHLNALVRKDIGELVERGRVLIITGGK